MDLKTTQPTERPFGPQMTTQVRLVRFHPVLITEVQSKVEGIYVCENNQRSKLEIEMLYKNLTIGDLATQLMSILSYK